MSEKQPPLAVLRYDVAVEEEGRIELEVPFAAGERVTVVVIPRPDDSYEDLLAASESSLAFWDNPYDLEDWNDH